MKSSCILFMRTLAAGVLLVCCACCSADARAEGVPAQTTPAVLTVVITVEGMSCASCSTAVRIALKRLDGVQDVQVSYERKRAVVKYQVGKVTPQDLVDAVNRLGYQASVAPKTS